LKYSRNAGLLLISIHLDSARVLPRPPQVIVKGEARFIQRACDGSTATTEGPIAGLGTKKTPSRFPERGF
jgi:hypothetical protein